MRYRKKPIMIEAFQFQRRNDGPVAYPDWYDDAITRNDIITHNTGKWGDMTQPAYCEIKTLEGTMRANEGDWIIMGINGEYYPCKPDIFEKSYELAERASLPEEEGKVENINTEKFRGLLQKYMAHDDSISITSGHVLWGNLISYIDAQISKAREEGRCAGFDKGWDISALFTDDEILQLTNLADKATADASDLRDQLRQQGNALEAMRELAEKAENEIVEVREASAYLAADAKGHSSRIHTLLDYITQLEAARQAPDLSKLVRWKRTYDGMTTGPKNDGRFVEFSDVQALLAQPLQQEGGKDSMPVEQEPKYGIRNGFLFNRASGEYIPSDEPVFIFRARDWHAVNILARYAGEVTDKDHAAAVWRRVDDFKRHWNTHPERMKQPDTAPQPPDKLQQASTAQVKPAKAWKCSFCGSSSAYGCDDVGCHGHEAGEETASTTDAEKGNQSTKFMRVGNSIATKPDRVIVATAITSAWADSVFGALTRATDAGQEYMPPLPDEVLADIEVFWLTVDGVADSFIRLSDIRASLSNVCADFITSRVTRAKATPDGMKDLPPLPEARRRGPEATGSYFNAYTADQMCDYASAAITATTAADPVAYLAAAIGNDGKVGAHALYFDRPEALRFCVVAAEKGNYNETRITPLYRAATPQQQK